MAIECGDERVTYAQLLERVNRCGSALVEHLGVRREERIALLLLDGPAFFYAFFGAIKAGAVPIPTNTLWKAADYRYLLNDSRARVLLVSEELLPKISEIPRADLPFLEHVVVAGASRVETPHVSFASLLDAWIAGVRAGADRAGRCGVLAVFVGKYGRAERLRPPAA